MLLLVEDDPLVREAVSEVLGAWGFKVTGCSSGTEALERLETPDLYSALILDVSLPDISGTQIVERLRSSGSTLPIILLSGFPQHIAVKDALLDAHTRFLQKPFELQSLQKLLRLIGIMPDPSSAAA